MSNAKFKWNEFSNLARADDLENYIKYAKSKDETKCTKKYSEQRAYNHNGFYHYTQLGNINEILKGRSFLLFHPGDSNDPCEAEITEKGKKFALSFSTGVHENIPLWYLYAGIDGQGGRLTFKKAHIYDMIHQAKYSLIEVGENKNVLAGGEKISLSKADFNCILQDVIYYEHVRDKVTLKYNTMVNHEHISWDEFKKFRNNNDAFVKGLVWYYEKETRLLVEVCDRVIQQLDSQKNYAIEMYFGNLEHVCKNLSILFAPGVTSKEEILNSGRFPGISQFLIDTSNVQCSSLAAQIKMDLCKNCPQKENNSKT